MKKYSLEDRIRYYNRIAEKEWKKFDTSHEMSAKLEFANGYVYAAQHGKSLNFGECSKASQAGQLRGAKAKEKKQQTKILICTLPQRRCK